MTEGNDTTATLDSNDVQTELERAEIILERVEEYREAAERIDGKYSRANEHRSPSLNEMPYGEELIRTKDLPGSLSEAAKNSERFSKPSLTEGPQRRLLNLWLKQSMTRRQPWKTALPSERVKPKMSEVDHSPNSSFKLNPLRG